VITRNEQESGSSPLVGSLFTCNIILAKAARSGPRLVPPLDLSGSAGSKGSMIVYKSSGTNCFAIKQVPTAVALSRSA
jgi:hypothetical protein